jgi:hypothetical protein
LFLRVQAMIGAPSEATRFTPGPAMIGRRPTEHLPPARPEPAADNSLEFHHSLLLLLDPDPGSIGQGSSFNWLIRQLFTGR